MKPIPQQTAFSAFKSLGRDKRARRLLAWFFYSEHMYITALLILPSYCIQGSDYATNFLFPFQGF